jgi:hypothetical protein
MLLSLFGLEGKEILKESLKLMLKVKKRVRKKLNLEK